METDTMKKDTSIEFRTDYENRSIINFLAERKMISSKGGWEVFVANLAVIAILILAFMISLKMNNTVLAGFMVIMALVIPANMYDKIKEKNERKYRNIVSAGKKGMYEDFRVDEDGVYVCRGTFEPFIKWEDLISFGIWNKSAWIETNPNVAYMEIEHGRFALCDLKELPTEKGEWFENLVISKKKKK